MSESTAPSPVQRSARRRRSVGVSLAVVGAVVGALAVAGGVAFAAVWRAAAVDTVGRVPFERPLAVPPLADSRVVAGERVFDLDVREGRTDLGTGAPSDTAGVNGAHLAPTVRVTRGETVRMAVTNSALHNRGCRRGRNPPASSSDLAM
ncbi:MAG: multicopper oxidase domain-containing protein [Kineosporiaceae bacterium]